MQPNFFSKNFLEQHIRDTLAFYDPQVFDQRGGFFQHFRDDGSIYDASTRHLVSSTRFVFNYAMADRYFDDLDYKGWVKHGLRYLQESHLQADGGYAWVLNGVEVDDATNHCYGFAFVMIAGATALLAGIKDGRTVLENAWRMMESHFWDTQSGLYADQANSAFSTIDPYRGQNANMHACEAMLWAYEATQEKHYLQRASILAKNITLRQAAQGRIWEHYDRNWEIDWEYNKDDPKNLFRPWGFQPGHFNEWSKLLLILHRLQPADWHLQRAGELFQISLKHAWDNEYGGICYGFAPDGNVCDTDKYFWVQAESFAAAALLANATGEQVYHDWYERIWEYCWQHMVDHKYGAWYRILTRANQRYDDKKSPAGKTDYHTMGACYEVLRLLSP
ncbi:MAG: AGE family epimerase/isomerase [Gammaproteobacteria bacterium]|nr:AGE family epimerase/isomerase [Gammaproteobacteria bacterium]